MKILFLNGVKISIEKEIDITTFLEKQNLSQKKNCHCNKWFHNS